MRRILIVWGHYSARFLAGKSAVIIVCGLTGCFHYQPERLRVHVGSCISSLSITASLSDGSIREIDWSPTEMGLPCDNWKQSTWWNIEIQRSNASGYHLNWAYPAEVR